MYYIVLDTTSMPAGPDSPDNNMQAQRVPGRDELHGAPGARARGMYKNKFEKLN